MKTNFDGELNYRDYVVHIFSAILFNVFLFLALKPSIPPCLWDLELHNELILTLVAIPILFLEGHFLLAIDRFLFVELFSWMFNSKNKASSIKKDENEDYEDPSDKYDQELAPYRSAREHLYDKYKCKVLFYLLFGKRIIGQSIIREKKYGFWKAGTKNEKKRLRYDALSDFFKGVGCGAWIALIVAFTQKNWYAVAVLFGIIVLAWLRCRFYSMLYVKYS